MDLGLTYRALASGQVDVIAGNSTDGLIDSLHLFALEDDRHYFPPYDAVPLLREEVARKHPEVRKAFAALAGKITESDMRRLNYQVDGERRDVATVVREFLSR
jgi:glycine betaine/choline ABC-type transport system substrate-binding protein